MKQQMQYRQFKYLPPTQPSRELATQLSTLEQLGYELRHRRTNSKAIDFTVLIELETSGSKLFKSVVVERDPLRDAVPVCEPIKLYVSNVYQSLYPDYPLKIRESHDLRAFFLFTRNEHDDINSAMRVVIDSEIGLPMEEYVRSELAALRTTGAVLAEPGRFAIDAGNSLYKRHIKAITQLAKWLSIDYYPMINREQQQSFYEDYCGARVMATTDSPTQCVNMLWNLNAMPAKFERMFGTEQSDLDCWIKTGGQGDEY